MVSSVTEGEDKPLKYPLMFRTCELVVVNKVDLLPHLDFDLDRFLHNLDKVNPGVERMLVSARTGEGCRRLARLARRWSRARGVAAAAAGPAIAQRGARLCARVAELLAAPHEANARFFEAEAERLARLCHRMAERFARGGRLIARGRLARGALRRPPRHRRVRAPGDRRQAGAAGDRALARGGPLAAQVDLLASPTTS